MGRDRDLAWLLCRSLGQGCRCEPFSWEAAIARSEAGIGRRDVGLKHRTPYIDQASLNVTEIICSCFLSAGINGSATTPG